MTDPIKQRQAHLITIAMQAPVTKTFGMRLSYNEKDEAVWQMPFHAGFDHGHGATHGGVLATLLDSAGWFTVACHFDTWVVTAEFTIRLLQPVSGQALKAVGHIQKLGKRLTTAEMEVRDQAGTIVAAGSGKFIVTQQPLPGHNG